MQAPMRGHAAPAAAAAGQTTRAGTLRVGRGGVCSSSSGRRRAMAVAATAAPSSSAGKEVTLLDYGAGNIRSIRNAIKKLGYAIKDVRADDQRPVQ